MSIHPTAIVDRRAELAADVKVGAHAVVGCGVVAGQGCEIGVGVVLEGRVILGVENRIMSGAVVGSEPQDLKFRGEDSLVRIGDRNTIREFVTINRGTEGGSGETVIGDGCLLMAYCHVAHDCFIGDGAILSNVVTMGGHVTIEDGAILSGMAGVHHFVTIGKATIVGGMSKVVKDIPPYMMADGHPARVHGLNVVGLKRRGISEENRKDLRQAFRLMYRSDLSSSAALERIEQEVPETPEVRYLVEFVRRSAGSSKGRAREPECTG